jgi:hypothetical protein
MRRRILIGLGVLLAFAGGLVVGRASGQAKPRMWADVLLDLSTDEVPRKTRVHTNLNHWDPGAETGPTPTPAPPSSSCSTASWRRPSATAGRRP